MNEQVLLDSEVQTTETSRAEAEEMGAIAFFGDKYGDSVRVVRAGAQSLEFCGGTHVGALGAIGSIQIISEGSIGSGTRRIEAVTGLQAVERTLATHDLLARAAGSLKAEPEALIDAIDRLQERLKLIERERDSLRHAALEAQAVALLSRADGDSLISEIPECSADELRSLAGDLLRRGSLRVVVVGSILDGKVAVAVATDGSLNAKDFVRDLGGLIGGGGGGSQELAVAGGKNPEGLADALNAARSAVGH